MKQILLFGGAFDPPHNGHVLVIRQALKQVKFDELWLMPCFSHTFDKKMSPVEDRLAMTTHLADSVSDPKVMESDFEITRKATGSTYETWLKLTDEYPKSEFSFLIGSDNLPTFTNWANWRELIRVMRFYVYLRAGYPARPWYTGMRLLHSPEVSYVSSTDIRKRLETGKGLPAGKAGIGDLVPEAVEEYIKEKGLYLVNEEGL